MASMRRQLVPAGGTDDVVQRGAVDIGHREVLERPFGPGRMNRHDVGVVELGQHFLLPEKSFPGGAGKVHIVPQHRLDGDPAAEWFLDRLVDGPHAAVRDLADDPEVAQPPGSRPFALISRLGPIQVPPQLGHGAKFRFPIGVSPGVVIDD